MKKCLFFCFLLSLPIFAQVNSDGDFQIWNKNAINLRLSQKSSFYGDIEFRYGDDSHKLYYKHIHLELNWNLNQYVTITPGFRFIWFRANNTWVKENDPLLQLTLFLLKTSRIIISDRNWIQYRNLPPLLGGHHRFLYRNRLQLSFPWHMGKSQINPYLANEIFYQERWGMFQNRSIIGFIMRRNERAFFDFFYMYRMLKNLGVADLGNNAESEKAWVQSNVIGLGAQFHF